MDVAKVRSGSPLSISSPAYAGFEKFSWCGGESHKQDKVYNELYCVGKVVELEHRSYNLQ